MKKYRLGDIAKVEISGVDKKIKENETEVLLCNFTNVYHNWNITKDCESNFMKATANKNEITKFSIHKGQVALTKDSETRDDIGVSTYIADDFENVLLGYHCALVTPDEKILNGNYLNCLLNTKTYQRYFENNASGSGQRFTLSVETLNNIPLSLPPIDEQERIAKVLSDIDSKIALNKKINRELETMAKEIYDYWFVQYDFPNEKGKPYKSSGGKMQWNDVLKREIPVGWEVKSIFEELEIQYGFPFNTELFCEEKTATPIVRIRDILDCTTSAYSKEPTEEKYTLHKKDLVIGMDGNFHMNFWSTNDAYLNQRCVRLRKKQKSNVSTMQAYFELHPIIKAKEQRAKGSTVGHLSDKDLKEMYIIVPNENNFFNPCEQFEALLDERINLINENNRLSQLRDELLPLLMNGQVAVNSNSPENKNRIKQIPNYNERYNQWVKTHGLAARGTVDDEVLRAIFDAIHDDDK